MGKLGNVHRFGTGSGSRSRPLSMRLGKRYGVRSDGIISAVEGRKARHDGVAMCLLRKDFAYALPLRREQRVARNRRLLVLLWLLAGAGWLCGRLVF